MTHTFPLRRPRAGLPAALAALPTALATLALACLVPAASLTAQDAGDHLGGWYTLEGSWAPGQGRVGYTADVQFRDFQVAGDFALLSLRGGIVFNASSRPLSLVVGAAWFLSGTPGSSQATQAERRVYQTLSYTMTATPRLRFGHRVRAEQRWFQPGYFRSRYRYRLQADVALGSPAFTGREVRLVVSDEVLFNGETESGGRTFDRLDQNRAYLALNWPVAKAARVETGYLNIFGGDRVLHRLRVTLKLAL